MDRNDALPRPILGKSDIPLSIAGMGLLAAGGDQGGETDDQKIPASRKDHSSH